MRDRKIKLSKGFCTVTEFYCFSLSGHNKKNVEIIKIKFSFWVNSEKLRKAPLFCFPKISRGGSTRCNSGGWKSSQTFRKIKILATCSEMWVCTYNRSVVLATDFTRSAFWDRHDFKNDFNPRIFEWYVSMRFGSFDCRHLRCWSFECTNGLD